MIKKKIDFQSTEKFVGKKGKIIMANYLQTRTLGALSPMVDKNKGDFSNRTNCAGAHIKNNVQTLAQDAVVIGGTAVGIRAAAKQSKFANIIGNFGKTVAKGYRTWLENIGLANNKGIQKLIQKFKNLPAANKGAVGTVAALGLAALSFIGCKHIYKSGQIDQKYTDKAKIEKHQQDVLD